MASQIAIAAPPPFPALSEHRTLRFVTIFLLYVAQGLPLGLLDVAVPSWLAQNGASAAAIGGVLAMTILPWSLKLVHGFVMDRFTFLAMGRRRPWIIASQAGIVVGLVAMAAVNPGAGQVGLIAAFAFSINLFSSMQDVAVDGLAVDLLPPDEIARVNGFMFGGQAIGIAAGGALGGYFLAWHGLPAAVLALAALAAAILLLVISVRERPGERLMPWSPGTATRRNLDLHLGAFRPIVGQVFTAMRRRETLTILPTFAAQSAILGIFLGMAPLIAVNHVGWEKDVYSGWTSQANLLSGLAGGLALGLLTERFGGRVMLIAGFFGLGLVSLAMLVLQASWTSPLLLVLCIFSIKLMKVQCQVAMGSISMRLCVPAVAATQFALMMAVANLGRTASSAMLGPLDALGGIPAMFAAMVALAVVGAAFAFAAKLGR